MSQPSSDFDRLVAEAEAASFSGWDFSWLDGRWIDSSPPWDYRQRVLAALPGVQSLLDMGTGGGEMLASLAPLPPDAWATENYPPNMPIARGRLEPLGVHVATGVADEALPFPDERFDLVINRHEFLRLGRDPAHPQARRPLHHPAGGRPRQPAPQRAAAR